MQSKTFIEIPSITLINVTDAENAIPINDNDKKANLYYLVLTS